MGWELCRHPENIVQVQFLPKLRKNVATKVLPSNNVSQDTSGGEHLVYDPGGVQEVGAVERGEGEWVERGRRGEGRERVRREKSEEGEE